MREWPARRPNSTTIRRRLLHRSADRREQKISFERVSVGKILVTFPRPETIDEKETPQEAKASRGCSQFTCALPTYTATSLSANFFRSFAIFGLITAAQYGWF